MLDASGRNNTGRLSGAAHVSTKPLSPYQPISDEDEWGEKVQLGHALEGESVCENVDGLQSSKSWTIELHVRRRDSVPSGSRIVLFSIFGAQVVLNPGGTVAVVSQDSEHDSGRRLPLHQWIHLALVSYAGSLSLFLSGSEALSEIPAPSPNGVCKISVGNTICETAEVRVWREARSGAQLRDLMSSVVPQLARVSKWKGLRIKVESANASMERSFDQPIFASSGLFATKTLRRVVEEKEMSPKSALLDLTAVAPPETAPKLTIPVESQVAAPELQASVRTESPKSIPMPKAEGDKPGAELTTLDLWRFTPPPTPPELAELFSVSPELLPASLPEAVARLDAMLEQSIVQPDVLQLDLRTIATIIQVISTYIRQHYRVGPYLAQMPPGELLTRLRVACTYVGLHNVLKQAHKTRWGTISALRLPLLPEHVLKLLRVCIKEAQQRKDRGAAITLSKTLLREFGPIIPTSEMESIRADINKQLAPGNTLVHCPFCTAQLADPLQISCNRGCKMGFSVCYLTGRVFATDQCARCKICATVVAANLGKDTHVRGNVPASTRTNIPKICPLCLCSGSLEPIV